MGNDLIKWDVNKSITKGNVHRATELVKTLKDAQKLIEFEMKDSVKAAHQTHKMILGVMDKQLNKYVEVEAILKSKFKEFHQKNPNVKVDSVAFADTLEPIIYDEDAIPDEYKVMKPDIKKIKSLIKSNGALFSCPGIKLVKSTNVRFYASKDKI